jgi:hypothetical protein
MGQMVLHAVEFRSQSLPRKCLLEKDGERATGAPIVQPTQYQIDVRPVDQKIEYLAREIGATILIECDVLHVRKSDTGFPQAILDGPRGKPGPMLYAPEPFLLRSGNELPIA